jgi:NhaA family Na+:H+ antiporter
MQTSIDPHRDTAADLSALDKPKFFRPLEKFLHVEAASGAVLLCAVIVALAWANWPLATSYHDVWHAEIGLYFGQWRASLPVHFFINDVLMTVFFLVVGLEIRRELHEGALADLKSASLPLAAAVGGIAVPAGIYWLLNSNGAREGWAIPTATDIAFAVGLLALLGKRVPNQLRVLLLAIAIVDDIAAILIIAVFYSSGVQLWGLVVAAAGVALIRLFNRIGIRTAWSYVAPGAVVWIGILQAGVHPTIAGVILGLLTPVRSPVDRSALLASSVALARKVRDRFTPQSDAPDIDPKEMIDPLAQLKNMQRELVPPVVRVQAALHSWVAFCIMPLFALANAGVAIDLSSIKLALADAVSVGIFCGLVFGKPLGIVLASAIAIRLNIASLPAGVTFRGVSIIGCLAGIGFTMSIFIAQLAFADEQMLALAKIAVLAASTMAGLIGLRMGAMLLRRELPSART